MNTKALFGSLGLIAVGAVIGTVLVTDAATKSATLSPPGDITGLNAVHLTYDKTADNIRVLIDACAKDATTGVQDCALVETTIAKSNVNLQAIATAAKNAWNTAKGY